MVNMRFLRDKRRGKIRNGTFPTAWEEILHRLVPIYRRLPAADRDELRGHILVLLEEKRFEGCAGLSITDDMRIAIAAQAAVLLLHRRTDYYPGLYSILVYPQTYTATGTRAEDWIVTEFEEERAGETWDQGSLVLSWDDVRGAATAAPDEEHRAPERGGGVPDSSADDAELVPAYNVVLHEFAHQLDAENGELDGMPALPSTGTREEWARVMQAAFDQLDSEYDSGKEAVIDDYALESPAEFFAVVTESFFETPFAVLEEYPALYDVLSRYYRQDPAGWPSE